MRSRTALLAASAAVCGALPAPGDEMACELNGVVQQNGECLCRRGWTGVTCGLLDFAPASSSGGFREPGYSAWGFTMPGPMPWKDGKYYAIVAFIVDHLGIDKYQQGMGLTMAVSDHPQGPYKRMVQPVNETLFAGVYTGNPGATYDPVTDTYLVYHQGCGTQPKNNNSCPPGETTPSPVLVMSSPTPYGPWTERGPVFNGSTLPYPQWDEWASNAVPGMLPNGSCLMMYRSHSYTAPSGKRFGENMGLAFADTWQGPFRKTQVDPIIAESNEDPFMWYDQKTGYYHALTHVLARDEHVGGRHLWSRDGLEWHVNTSHLALGKHVTLDNGTVWELARRERPFILFDKDGSTPEVVFSGVELAAEKPYVFVLAQPVQW